MCENVLNFYKNQFFRLLLVGFIFFFSFSFLFSESFRVYSVVPAVLEDQVSSVNVQVGINDVLYITLPKEKNFMRGLDIEVKIPQEVAAWRDAVAYSIYRDISPTPSPSVIDYSGERISIFTFPGRLSQNIKIPFKNKIEFKESPYYTIMPEIDIDKDDTVFLRMQLAMKGTFDGIDKAKFDITVKPVLADEGLLIIDPIFPKNGDNTDKAYSVFIDEKQIIDFNNGIILPTGLHHLSITSDYYRNEVRTFSIEQAKTSILQIEFQDINPTIFISSPENVQVFVNDELFNVSSDPVVIEPGNYTVKFVVGDYEVVKTLTAINGKSYDVSLSIDVQITEK